MLVYFSGEDTVTKLIAKRLIRFVLPCDNLDLEDVNPRDYGTRALEKLELVCELGKKAPVICVFDSDGDCAVEILKKYASKGWKSDYLAINLAIDEGETWLMADRAGFSQYFGIKLTNIPMLKDGSVELSSAIPYKTSLYFLNELVPLSFKKEVLNNFKSERMGKKPPTYNNMWPDFIQNHWDIKNASLNSRSLARAIQRIQSVFLNEQTLHQKRF